MTTTITSGPFADLTAFTGTTGTVASSVKAGLTTAITNIESLLVQEDGMVMASPDFSLLNKLSGTKIQAELAALRAAIVAHA